MIIWSGFGFFVAIFVFAAALICNFVFDAMLGEGYYSSHKWAIGVAMFLAAVPTWLTGIYLKGRRAQTVVDKQTGKEIVFQHGHHSLFWIPMNTWGPILIAIGIILCVLDVVT